MICSGNYRCTCFDVKHECVFNSPLISKFQDSIPISCIHFIMLLYPDFVCCRKRKGLYQSIISYVLTTFTSFFKFLRLKRDVYLIMSDKFIPRRLLFFSICASWSKCRVKLIFSIHHIELNSQYFSSIIVVLFVSHFLLNNQHCLSLVQLNLYPLWL